MQSLLKKIKKLMENKMGKGQELYKKAKSIIPGGTQLLSKRPEMYLPDYWPAYYSKAKGCEIWDLDGKKYIDMSNMCVGAAILGYADEDVDSAVIEGIKKANITTLNAPEEIEIAEILLELHPWANMVRYARGGGDGMSVAVRIARAYSKKDIILFCGYHGWHDWYLAANLADDSALDGHLLPGLSPNGTPRNLKGTSFPFVYNDTKGFIELYNKHKDNIGAIVMESIRNDEPDINFIKTIKDITKNNKIPLIIDEVSAGFRLNIGGAHLLYNIEPDIAVLAKAISNGYPMAAIIGKSEVMQAAQDSFISSTYWTDRIGPVASIATIKKIKKNNVPEHLKYCGKKIQEGWKRIAEKNNLKIKVGGIYPLSHFDFEYYNPLVLKTLYTQLMLEKGFLATTGYYASFAHKDKHIEKYLKATDEAFSYISDAIKSGNPEKYLKGPVCHSGFKRLT